MREDDKKRHESEFHDHDMNEWQVWLCFMIFSIYHFVPTCCFMCVCTYTHGVCTYSFRWWWHEWGTSMSESCSACMCIVDTWYVLFRCVIKHQWVLPCTYVYWWYFDMWCSDVSSNIKKSCHEYMCNADTLYVNSSYAYLNINEFCHVYMCIFDTLYELFTSLIQNRGVLPCIYVYCWYFDMCYSDVSSNIRCIIKHQMYHQISVSLAMNICVFLILYMNYSYVYSNINESCHVYMCIVDTLYE